MTKVKAKRNLFVQSIRTGKKIGDVFILNDLEAKSFAKAGFVEIIGKEKEIKKTKDITAKDKETVDIDVEEK